MSERRIDLNLQQAGFGAASLKTGGEGAGAQPRSPADAQDEARFAAALAKEPAQADGAECEPAPRPFALFGNAPASAAPTPAQRSPNPLAQGLGDAVERLMVGEGTSGEQVRMELKDDVLPGVCVAIEEREGRLQVDFICSVERSRLKLTDALPDMAHTLAERLRRDVLMRVQTDDEEDPCLVEQLVTV